MKIDKIDCTKFGARQIHTEVETAEVTNNSEWPTLFLSPLYLEGEPGFKTIRVEWLFEGETRAEVEENISHLAALCLEPRVLTLDKRDFLYRAIMTGTSQEAINTLGTAVRYTIEYKGVAVKKQKKELLNRSLETTFKNKGNLKSPAIVEITPSITETVLTIEGLADSPITIRNLKAGKKIILNGETGRITEEGNSNKLPDVDFWEVPRVLPGENKIKLSKKTVDMTILYDPRFF